MEISKLIRLACETYAFHGQLGLDCMELPQCCLVRDQANPNVWSSNKVYDIKIDAPEHISSMMQAVEEWFQGNAYRHFVIDPYTSDFFSAYLALNDYAEQVPILQMILTGALPDLKGGLELIPVTSADHWDILYSLVRQDHQEGARTQGRRLNEMVTQGIVEAYKRKASACQFFIAVLDGVRCAYGSGINGPNGMGMVDDLFTLPNFRQRGIASAIIAHCVEFVRNRGAGPILIGGHVSDKPKKLYFRLGFQPICLTRSFIKKV